MSFSDKTLGFLFENRLHDSKEWYHEHMDDYRNYVVTPFADFISALQPTLFEIDEEIICNPKKISRLYRDTRFSKGGSVFRDNVWAVFGRRSEPFEELPCFYFELSTSGFSYGCGYYHTGTESMDAIRTLILKNDVSYKAALKAYENQSVFELYGDMYKRNHYPEQSEKNCNWLNRKTIGLSTSGNDFGLLFSEELPAVIAEQYRQIAPIYSFFMKAEALALKRRTDLSEKID